MKKSDFIKIVKDIGGYSSAKAAEEAMDSVFSGLLEVLKQKDAINIKGFGTFSTAEVAEKKGTIPGTNNEYIAPAHTAPKFKFSRSAKEHINS